METSTAIQQSCTRDKGNCFLTSQEGGGERNGGGGRGEDGEEGEQTPEGGGGRDQNYNTVFRSNAAKLYSWAKAIPVNEKLEKKEMTATMQSSVVMQQSCNCQPR